MNEFSFWAGFSFAQFHLLDKTNYSSLLSVGLNTHKLKIHKDEKGNKTG